MTRFLLICFMALSVSFPAAADMFPKKDISITRADGTTAEFHVEVATDDFQHERGLMYRESLANDAGMLFMYYMPGLRSFWMKNTLIPLDILFFSDTGALVYVHRSAKPKDLTPISPDRADICAVLEIPGGQAEAQNLKIGDQLILDQATVCLPEGSGSRTLPTKRPKLGGGV